MHLPEIPPYHRQHGFYQIERLDPLLRLTIAEGMNKELIAQYQADMARHIEQLSNQLWGLHLIIHGDVLMPPDAYEALIEVTRNHKRLGRCATAVKLINPSAVGMLKAFWSHIYQSAEIPYLFCDNDAEAEEWLYSQITREQQRRRMAG